MTTAETLLRQMLANSKTLRDDCDTVNAEHEQKQRERRAEALRKLIQRQAND